MKLVQDLADHLPVRSDRNIAVKVTRDAERWLRSGSPWLYDGSINSMSFEGAPGDLAVVFDHDRAFHAIGLYDPHSPIRVKVLHQGKPVTIDADFWRLRVASALDRRASLIADPETTAYRCLHGENDQLPGLVADRYESTMVVKLYSAIWWPHLVDVVEALVDATGVERVVLRLARNVDSLPGMRDGTVVHGPDIDGPVMFSERGLVMEADVVNGQKTGYFLDQRDNRNLVRGMAEGAEVLDVFASTGGFSVAAAAGGAKSVHLVDLAAPAIETAQRNLNHNRQRAEVRAAKVDTTVGDAFEVLRDFAQQGRQFDVVIVDPPAFAQNQESIDRAMRAYHKLAELAVAVVRPGGVLVQCSCSSRVPADDFFDAVRTGASAGRRSINEIRRTFHAVDHPVGFEYGSYLKALYATVS